MLMHGAAWAASSNPCDVAGVVTLKELRWLLWRLCVASFALFLPDCALFLADVACAVAPGRQVRRRHGPLRRLDLHPR
eukprot:3937171-Rhodomonas_salina.1